MDTASSTQHEIPALIGVFPVRQQRERVLVKTTYSHHVVAFDVGIVMVEDAPLRDKAAAALKYASLPLHLVPHAKAAERLAKVLLSVSPEGRASARRLAELDVLTPQGLAEKFPNHVSALSIAQMTSAVLRRVRPRELTIRYRPHCSHDETELWLRLASAEIAGEAARVMTELLDDKFTEATWSQGVRGVARGILPFRGT